MENTKKKKSDEIISEIYNNNPLLRSYLNFTKPQTDDLTEEQKKENFIRAIMDAGKINPKE